MSIPAGEQAAGASQTTPNLGRVKKENDSNSMDPHHFTVKFSLQDNNEFTIQSGQPCTVLEAIQSDETLKMKIKCADENFIIQLGKEDKKYTVATHFICIGDGECVIIHCKSKEVEKTLYIFVNLFSKDKYVFFYIDTVGGKNPKKKKGFRNESVKPFKYLFVYREKGMTVEDTLKRDDLGDSHLSNNTNPQLTPFPDESYQEPLNLRKENFGKIQQSFSEVHRVKKVLELGGSVCRLSVGNVVGTAFVLFDNFILTNAHLFEKYVKGKELQTDVEVYAQFWYEDPGPGKNYSYFNVKKTFVDFDVELDYAILELNPKGKTLNQQTNDVKVPQGLLKVFGPLPQNGEICIIGHPVGQVKNMDPTWIIEYKDREQVVKDHLHKYKDLELVKKISELIKDAGLDDIIISKDVATYHSSMLYGASGSPLFDALCRVFGLHTAGFVYEYPDNITQSVMEYAQSVLVIFKRFVENLKKSGNKELLERVEKEANGNSYLTDILTQVLASRSREDSEEN